MRVLLTHNNIYRVHRMVTVMENRPVDPGSIQGNHQQSIYIFHKDKT